MINFNWCFDVVILIHCVHILQSFGEHQLNSLLTALKKSVTSLLFGFLYFQAFLLLLWLWYYLADVKDNFICFSLTCFIAAHLAYLYWFLLDITSDLELAKFDGKRRPNHNVNGVFWILLLNLGIYVADHILRVPILLNPIVGIYGLLLWSWVMCIKIIS